MSGIEFRDGESSALRMVCNCKPMLFDTPDESGRIRQLNVHGNDYQRKDDDRQIGYLRLL